MSRLYQIMFVSAAALLVFGLTLTANAHTLPVLCDFEGGSACYDIGTTQIYGHWRDTAQNSYIYLSNNGGTLNEYLIMGRRTSVPNPTTIYDTTPSSAEDYSLFTVPVNYTFTLTADVQADEFGVAYLGMFDPKSTGGVRGISIGYMYDGRTSGDYDDVVRHYSFTTEAFGTEYPWKPNYTVPNKDNNPIVRMSLSLENKGATGVLTYHVDEISALGATTILENIYNASFDVTYGTGDGELNFNPATNGFEVVLSRNIGTVGGYVLFDNVKMTLVPEPSTFALLACGLFGLLAYAWRKRR